MKRKAQGALEYLFMIAAALIIIFVVVRYLTTSGKTASEIAGSSANQSVKALENLTQEVNATS